MKPTSYWNLKGEPIPQGYIPAVEAAGILGISQNAFYTRVLAGTLPQGKEGHYYRFLGGEDGVPQTAVPVKKVWNRAEVEAAAKLAKYKPTGRFKKAAAIPEGFVRAELAAEMLGLDINSFLGKVKVGFLPAGTPTKIGRKVANLWSKEELRALAPTPPEDTGKPTPTDRALLSRLRSYADADGFVSGDATDLVLGNPVREYDRRSIGRLRTANLIRTSIDNLGRMICTVAPESSERPGSKAWRSF